MMGWKIGMARREVHMGFYGRFLVAGVIEPLIE